MNVNQAPIIPQNVLEYLEKTFPDRAGDRKDTPEDRLWKDAQVSVVRHLRAIFIGQMGRLVK